MADQVKLFVGGLPDSFGEAELRELFSPHGVVREAVILASKSSLSPSLSSRLSLSPRPHPHPHPNPNPNSNSNPNPPGDPRVKEHEWAEVRLRLLPDAHRAGDGRGGDRHARRPPLPAGRGQAHPGQGSEELVGVDTECW